MKKKLPRFRIKERTRIYGNSKIISSFYPQELHMLFWLFPIYVTMSHRGGYDIVCVTIEDARKYIDRELEQERNEKIVKDVTRFRPYK